MSFTIDHYITKFEAIPEENWTTQRFSSPDGKHCALGFCDTDLVGNGFSSERGMLQSLFSKHLNYNVALVNDGKNLEYPQPTPKQRILTACRDLKKIIEDKKKAASILSSSNNHQK